MSETTRDNFWKIVERKQNAEARVRKLEARKEWRCYHCDYVATTNEEAVAHFGPYPPIAHPKCILDAKDRRITELESLLAEQDAQLAQMRADLTALANADEWKIRERWRAEGFDAPEPCAADMLRILILRAITPASAPASDGERTNG